MDKKESTAYKWFVIGFNLVLSYIGTQEIEGIINYPLNDIEGMFKDCYLDVLLKELDKKEGKKCLKD